MNGTYRFIIVYILLAATWGYLDFHTDRTIPVAKPLIEFPGNVQGWHVTSQSSFGKEILNVLRPTDYLSRQYSRMTGDTIGLYIGYHDGGKDSGEIHSPKHCLPGSGWQEISSDRMDLVTPKGHVNLVKAVYQKGENRELFFYWFQVQGNTLTNEYALKVAEIMNSLFHGRRDAAFVRISVPIIADEKGAETSGIDFIREIYPLIGNFIPS